MFTDYDPLWPRVALTGIILIKASTCVSQSYSSVIATVLDIRARYLCAQMSSVTLLVNFIHAYYALYWLPYKGDFYLIVRRLSVHV